MNLVNPKNSADLMSHLRAIGHGEGRAVGVGEGGGGEAAPAAGGQL